MEVTGLLRLPLELRRLIILETLKQGRREEPILSKPFVDSRVRLRNRFDENYPTQTNIFVPKQKGFINGNALLQTNRQLRKDTLDLIEDTLKRGIVDIPYILDVMVIKDVGVLPTWMSYPYRPSGHVKQIQVNMRLFRLDKDIVPKNWISTSLYEKSGHHGIIVQQWTIIVVLLFYVMGRFSASPKNTIKTESTTLPEEGLNNQKKDDSERVDAYISAHVPYVVEDMPIRVQPFAHFANGKPVYSFVEDQEKPNPSRDWTYTIVTDERRRHGENDKTWLWRVSGRSDTSQLEKGIGEPLYTCARCYSRSVRTNLAPIRLYLDAVVRNIHTIRLDKENGEDVVGGTGYASWEQRFIDIIRRVMFSGVFETEKQKQYEEENMRHLSKLLDRRKDLGWWDDDHFQRLVNAYRID